MRYSNVHIDAIGYELPPHVVSSAALDDRLAPVYQALCLPPRQIESLTGVRERRFWDPDMPMSQGALRAAQRALAAAEIDPGEIGLLIYAGVCRDQLEPATACAVAHGLGLAPDLELYDISNACLGVVNGMVHVANAIELGQIRAGLVVSCESARQIVDTVIDELRASPNMEDFKTKVATLTGGSGAVAVLLTATGHTGGQGRRLRGGVVRSATQHHALCRWWPDTGIPACVPTRMETHAVNVLENGVRLGAETWRAFLAEMDWAEKPDKLICHQVGAANRDAILRAIEMPRERDFVTFPHLGNMGTVSLPLTAAIAAEREFLAPGDRVAFLGIGSGLNCVMLGVEW